MNRTLLLTLMLALCGSAVAERSTAHAQDALYDVYNFKIVSSDNSTQLIIETTGSVRFSDEFQALPPNLTIELLGASPDLQLRAYEDVYRGGVRHVVVSAPTPDLVRFDVALTGVSSYAIYEEGNDLYVTFDNPTEAFATYEANPAQIVTEMPQPTPLAQPAAPAMPAPPSIRQEEFEAGLPGINGESISFSFQDADIMTVIRAFSEVSGRSIVAGSGIQDLLITADIRSQPWDEALVTLMRANGLEVRVENEIIRVDSVQNLRETETLVDLHTEVIHLNFIAADDVVEVVTPLLSERGAVQPDAKTNALVVTDVQERLFQVDEIIRELDVQTPQVTIKAKIVFVNKVDLRELGVTWKIQNLNNPTVDTHLLASTDGSIADPFLDLAIGTIASGLNIGGLLQALEQRQLADIQAEPQTTVLNNLPAEVFVGERTPIRVLDASSGTVAAQATVELIDTGIILRVTPTITSNGKVLMNLWAERSGVSVSDPEVGVTFNTQRATSQILVNDGETAVIGGLTVQDVSTSRSGVPVLKDIPGLGFFFRSESKRAEKRDLLIFVTPYIVPIEKAAYGGAADASEAAEVVYNDDIATASCAFEQVWYQTDQPIVHNGVRWLKFSTPVEQSSADLIPVGNYRGVPVYTTVETAATEVYLPSCIEDSFQAYRPVSELHGTTG